MVGNKLELEIINIFNRNLTLLLSINQIAHRLKKAYPHINAKVNKLIKAGILNKTQIGRSHLCSINLNNDHAIALLTLNEIQKKNKLLIKLDTSKKLIDEINQIKREFRVYSIVYHKDSLIFVLDYIHDKEAIKNLYFKIKKFNLQFFDKKDFQNHVLNRQKILQEITILTSFESYFDIVNEIKDQLMISQLK